MDWPSPWYYGLAQQNNITMLIPILKDEELDLLHLCSLSYCFTVRHEPCLNSNLERQNDVFDIK